MRIAVIGAKGLPPTQGGIEHYCAGLYPRLVAHGHSVDLFARSSYTERPSFHQDVFEGVRVISLPYIVKGGLEAITSSAMGAIATLFSSYDIVHFHALGPSLFTWLPRLVRSIPVVVTCHGLDWQRDKWGKLSSSLIRAGEKTGVRYAQRIVVVSRDLEAYFGNTYGLKPLYIPNAPVGYAASDSNFTYGKSLGLTRNRYLVFVGRLVPEKCPDLLIKAFQTLRPAGWKLALVGSSSNTTSFVSQLTRAARGSDDIVFTGQLQGSQLAEIVRGAGLFVLPSNLEGTPLALLEAMQEGIPAVASDIPPIQALLSGSRGLIFKVDDLNSLVSSLRWALQHPDEMSAMARKAKEYVTLNHSWNVVADENLKLYESLVATSTPPSLKVKQSKKLLKL